MLERLFGRKKTKITDSSQNPETQEEQSGAAEPSANASLEQGNSPANAKSEAAELENKPVSAESQSGSRSQAAPAPALELERAMQANATMDTHDTRLKVYQELLFSEMLLALADTPQDAAAPSESTAGQAQKHPQQNGQLVDAQNISVAILKNSANMQFAVAFTSGDAARKWRPQGGNYVSIKGQDIFKLLESSPAEVIVINPASIPFIVLPKIDYRQLAMGVVPQNTQSPVQNPPPQAVAQAEADAQAQAHEGEQGQMQVAFPPDVFNEEQKSFATTLLMIHSNVEAAVFGAIRPPGAKENEWLRTIFLKVSGIEPKQEVVQKLCQEIKDSILDNKSLFKDINFEVGIMPDPQFWIAMHQNNIVIFDKNPPELPAERPPTERPAGVVDAKS